MNTIFEGEAKLSPGSFQQGGEQLTRTEDIVRWWKEHFDKLLDPTDTTSIEEARITEIVNKLCSGTKDG